MEQPISLWMMEPGAFDPTPCRGIATTILHTAHMYIYHVLNHHGDLFSHTLAMLCQMLDTVSAWFDKAWSALTDPFYHPWLLCGSVKAPQPMGRKRIPRSRGMWWRTLTNGIKCTGKTHSIQGGVSLHLPMPVRPVGCSVLAARRDPFSLHEHCVLWF